ncbi:MAG: TPM domain-containing protein, partial [Jiangellaceae bacterium]
VRVQAAELAVGQAAQLLDAIDTHAGELEKAATGMRGALADVQQDLAEAKAFVADTTGGPSADELAGSLAAAEAAVTTVEQGIAAGRYDPLAAMRRLQEAGGALDQSLIGVRDAQARAQRASASLERAVLAARSEIAATTDFITTRRGGVGGEARTRLVEAQRHLDQAMALAQSDPESALSYAQQADSLAEQAGQLARRDVGAFDTGQAGGGISGQGSGMGGAILGGILGGLLSGGGGGSSYGGGMSWRSGRGSAWGGRPSRSSGGGSRRGGGSRSRRGGSGRF